MALTESVVDMLDLAEERVKAVRKCVLGAPEGQVPSRSQHGVSLRVADFRVDPVPGGRGINQVEALGLARPGFEGGDVYLGRHTSELATGYVGEPRAQLDTDNRDATFENRPGRLACAAADLESAVVLLQASKSEEVCEERRRVGWAGI